MTLAAKTVTSTVPIVMSGSSDPVRAGLVASLARPGGNVTGLSSDTEPENEAKRLELLKEAIPRISRVAYLGTKADWVSPLGQAARRAAQSLGVTVLHAEHTPSDYISAFALIERERPDAVFAALNTPTYANRELIVGFVLKGQLPAMFPFRELVEAGGLMSYGVDVTEPWRRAAHYVDRILKGANPAELPVERPTKFELVINLKTARALGLSIPPLLLGRVDQLIE